MGQEVVVVGYAETPITLKGGASAFELAGDVFERLLLRTGLDKDRIDGLAVSNSISESSSPFHAILMNDALGITPKWLTTSGIGGCSALAGLARAASAIRDGQCELAVVLSADAPSATGPSPSTAFRPEFQVPIGVQAPTTAFGLLMNRYAHQHALRPEALGRIAITQREHALLNENAVDKLRKSITMDDYLASKMVADPLRVLDCVMSCDGANAFLVTTPEFANREGWERQARLVTYAEVTNFGGSDPLFNITRNGFEQVASSVWARSRWRPSDIDHFQPYDDFTIAVLLQLEAFGFCGLGQGSDYVLDTDLSWRGDLPLNTGGGQISAGQPGLAGGGVQVIEALRQLFGEGGARQVPRSRRALVTGIGGVLYGRNWSASCAALLEV